MYLSNSNVKVFPSAIDRTTFPYSKAFTEANIRRLITSSALRPTAIVSFYKYAADLTTVVDMKEEYIAESDSSELTMELLIDGYYASITFSLNSVLSKFRELNPGEHPTNVYAAMVVDNGNIDYPQLQGKEELEGDIFTAVQLVSDLDDVENEPDNANPEVLSIQILTKTDDGWLTVQKNWKYQIDGGEIS